MAVKTFLVGLTIIVKQLCHYFIKYQKLITLNINASSLTDVQKEIVLTFLGQIQAACTLLELITGY